MPPALRMMGRYTSLQEIFLNLIDNARDAIREAKRNDGLISVHGRSDGNGSLYVDVTDNGAGIRREDLYRVFDPFFSTKEVGKGTGLGLSVVHSIVSNHGGKIAADSDGSTFTRFSIEFPSKILDLSDRRSNDPAAQVLRILAVDDDIEILSILKRSLRRLGHHVECTSTGSRALQLLSKNQFDVLLLDMHLPGMDGRGIIERLESVQPPVSVRPVLLTGDTMNEEIARFAADHGLPVVTKPVDFTKLNDLLQDTAARTGDGIHPIDANV